LQLVDAFVDLKLLEKKYLPEFDHKLFRHVVEDPFNLCKQCLRTDSGIDLANDKTYHRHFFNTQVLLDLFCDPGFRHLLDNSVPVELVPINFSSEHLITSLGQLGIEGFGLIEYLKTDLLTISLFLVRISMR